jgi:hypothetical protein
VLFKIKIFTSVKAKLIEFKTENLTPEFIRSSKSKLLDSDTFATIFVQNFRDKQQGFCNPVDSCGSLSFSHSSQLLPGIC